MSFLGHGKLDGAPDAPILVQAHPGEGRHQPVQDERAARPLGERESEQPLEGVGEVSSRLRVFRVEAGAELQQAARDRQARHQPRGMGEQTAGQIVHRVVGPQAAQADLEGAGDVALVAGEGTGPARCLGILDQRDVRQQVRPPQLGEVGGGRAERLVAVAGEVAAGELQGQRQVAEFVRDAVEAGIVGGKVRPMPAQEDQALAAGQAAQRQHRDAAGLGPGRAPRGDEQPAAAALRHPGVDQGLVLAVVEDQQTRQRAGPGGSHQRHAFGQQAGAEAGLGAQGRRAGGDGFRDSLRVGAGDEEHAAREPAAVAVGELHRELRLALAA